MTNPYLTSENIKKMTEQGHMGHFFPANLTGIDSRESLGISAPSAPQPLKDQIMIDPYDRNAVILLLRTAAAHVSDGIPNHTLHSQLWQLSDHLEQED
ncbi:hypothetical protein [Glutamicibacter uratoxydans]|uniref:hypothetical protein n=1 Tax=Glutamicibacter uratoxydans TaxID=43667 RepID=UPI003D6FDBE4